MISSLKKDVNKKANSDVDRSSLFLHIPFGKLSGSEKQRNTPDTRQRYQGVNDSCGYRVHSAANPRHSIKLEYADTAPIKRSHNSKHKRYSVKYHTNLRVKNQRQSSIQ